MNKNIEVWKDIDGYLGLYQVSNLGRVKSLDRYINNGKCLVFKKGQILKIKEYKGYCYIKLSKHHKYNQYLVHRLVAQAFIPNPENKPCIDHINTNRTDNRVENLRWVTQKENVNNPISISKMKKNHHLKNRFGKLHPSSKPIIQFTKDGEFIRKWDCIKDVERELNFSGGYVGNCCKGKYKTAYNFIWRYYYKGIYLKKHILLKDNKVA